MKIRCLLTAVILAALCLLVLRTNAQTPPDAAALHQQGLARQQAGDFKGAVDLAEQATKADPTKPEYFSQYGIALSQRMNEVNFLQMAMIAGRMRKAFEKSLELDPNHVAGLIGLSRYHTNAPEIAGGSLAKAREYALRLLKLVPLQGEMELGRIAGKDEDYAEALKHFEAAAVLKPESAGVHLACGQTLAKLGRKAEARVQLETALKLKPDLDAAKKALAELDAPASP